MVHKLIGRLLRLRYAFALVLVGAGAVLLVNELTYHRTTEALRNGIALTDARIATARVMQLLTDAETGQRGFLLTQQPEYLEPYEQAKAELPALREEVSRFLQASGADGPQAAASMSAAIEAKLSELATVLQLSRAGKREEAIAVLRSGIGRDHMATLRAMFKTKLDEATALQAQARVSIYDALLVSRLALAAFTLLGVVGLYALLRQIQLRDRERLQRQRELEEQVRLRTADLQRLAGHLQNVREDERAHLARELHDELGGLLTAAKLDLARLRMRIVDDGAALERLDQANQRLNEGIAFKRRVVEDLHPSALAILGLKSALQELCHQIQERLSVPVHVALEDIALAPADELAVFRFVQEALTNVSKYALARNVWVSLRRGDAAWELEVRDDGVGFAPTMPQAGHHGLAGMRFRVESIGGVLNIDSAPGRGTRLCARFAPAGAVPKDTPLPMRLATPLA